MKELSKVTTANPAKNKADLLFSYPPTSETKNPPNIPPVKGPKTEAPLYKGTNFVIFSSSGILRSSMT